MEAGDVVAGRYRLIERLGAGGMGEVWRAEQTALGREVALKLVQEGAAQALGDARARFRREAELAAEVEHRNVVGIIDFGTTDEGTQYLVMPLLKGEPLESRLARRPPSILELLEWARGVLGGLAAIHDKGIVHRDLKPANVFLAEDADGVVPKLLDFGISRRAEAGAAGLTALGTAIGTPRYMAPEQFESARDVDARADLWSAGAMLYEALAGRAPYEADDPFAIFRAILEGDPPPLASLRPELPAALSEIVHRALARDPSRRFESARAMRATIDGLLASGALGEDGARLVARAAASGAALAPTVAGASGAPVARTVAMAGATEAMAPARSGATQAMAPPAQVVSAPLEAAARPASRASALAALGAVVLAAAGVGAYLVWAPGGSSDAPIASVAEPPPDAGPPAVDAGTEPPAVHPPPPPSGWVVSGAPTDLSILAQTWAGLPEPLRAREARFVETPRGWVQVVPASTPPDVLTALIRGLHGGTLAGEYDPSVGLRPALLRTTVRLNVRQRASIESDVLRTLPHDAIVVGLYGAVHEETSAAEGDGAMTHFVVAEDSIGWARSRYLVPYRGCVADPFELFDGLDEADAPDEDELDPDPTLEDGDELERMGATAVIARSHAFVAGRRQEVFVFASTSQRSRESVVGVYRTSGECELERLHVYRVPGLLDEHFFTDTLPTGGQTLVMISYADGSADAARGVMQWRAYPLGSDAIVWSERLPTAGYLEDRRRTGISGTRDRAGRRGGDDAVLRLREPGGARPAYRWDGAALVRVEADGASPVEAGE